jgi:hypothetical protein
VSGWDNGFVAIRAAKPNVLTSMKLSLGLISILLAGGCLAQAPWQPPKTSLPPDFVEATKALLGHGLADPRGGTFSRVKVLTGTALSHGMSPEEGFGWVLPGGTKVVLVDGLKYDVFQNLGPATLADLYPYNWIATIRINQPSIALPALLLVMGEPDQAELVKTPSSPARSGPALYDHLIWTYRMQEAECLQDYEDSKAAKWADGLEEVLQAFQASDVHYRANGLNLDPPEIAELERDIDDAKRRAMESEARIDLVAMEKLPQAERLASLVSALDEVNAISPERDSTDWYREPIIKAICLEKRAAVPALIHAYESDKRLTRTVLGEYFLPRRSRQPVRSAAWACLLYVWPVVSTFNGVGANVRASKMLALWEKTKNLTESEQWLQILSDDQAGAANWFRAAMHLTDPAGLRRVGDTGYGGESLFRVRGNIGSLTGDDLRARDGAEITELLKRRTVAMTARFFQTDSIQINELVDGLRMAHATVKWNPVGSQRLLKRLTERGLAMYSKWIKDGDTAPLDVSGDIAALLADRMSLGDDGAAKDFEKLLVPSHLGSWPERQLKPLWTAPGNPTVQSAGYDLAKSILISNDPDKLRDLSALVRLASDTPILLSKGYRRFLVDALRSSRNLGWAEETKGAQPQVKFDIKVASGIMNLPQGVQSSDVLQERVSVDTSDWVAQELSQLKSAPTFALIWPEAKRAEAKQMMIRWLQEPGKDWNSVVTSLPYAYWSSDR